MNFPRPAVENRNQIHTARVAIQPLSGLSMLEAVPKNGVDRLLTPPIQTEQGGKIYNIKPKDLAKAQAHWRRKSAQRNQPGNCGRCGKPNTDPTHRHCEACRDYQRRRKLQAVPVVVDEKAIKKLERRIAAMEHNFALMRLDKRRVYKLAYARGKKTGITLAKYHDAYPPMSTEELATMSHAYDKKR